MSIDDFYISYSHCPYPTNHAEEQEYSSNFANKQGHVSRAIKSAAHSPDCSPCYEGCSPVSHSDDTHSIPSSENDSLSYDTLNSLTHRFCPPIRLYQKDSRLFSSRFSALRSFDQIGRYAIQRVNDSECPLLLDNIKDRYIVVARTIEQIIVRNNKYDDDIMVRSNEYDYCVYKIGIFNCSGCKDSELDEFIRKMDTAFCVLLQVIAAAAADSKQTAEHVRSFSVDIERRFPRVRFVQTYADAYQFSHGSITYVSKENRRSLADRLLALAPLPISVGMSLDGRVHIRRHSPMDCWPRYARLLSSLIYNYESSTQFFDSQYKLAGLSFDEGEVKRRAFLDRIASECKKDLDTPIESSFDKVRSNVKLLAPFGENLSKENLDLVTEYVFARYCANAILHMLSNEERLKLLTAMWAVLYTPENLYDIFSTDLKQARDQLTHIQQFYQITDDQLEDL